MRQVSAVTIAPGTGLPCRSTTSAQRVARPEPEFQSRLLLGMHLPQIGCITLGGCTVTTDAPDGQFSSMKPPPALVFVFGSESPLSPPLTHAPATGLPWGSSTRPLTVKPRVRMATVPMSRDTRPLPRRKRGASTATLTPLLTTLSASNETVVGTIAVAPAPGE